MIIKILKKIFNIIKNKKTEYIKKKLFREFRKKNTHNGINLKSVVNLDYVSVGKKSYGDLHISYGSPEKYKLTIGNYCSIAPGVLFLLANDHSTKSISTYPFKILEFGLGAEAKSKGNITVGDDVWIASNATICSGVTIGQGAVIGCNAVVTKDIPPYAIAGGNPAKVIKYRFSDEIIKKLTSINIVKLFDSFTEKDLDFIYDENLTLEKLESFIKNKNMDI